MALEHQVSILEHVILLKILVCHYCNTLHVKIY